MQHRLVSGRARLFLGSLLSGLLALTPELSGAAPRPAPAHQKGKRPAPRSTSVRPPPRRPLSPSVAHLRDGAAAFFDGRYADARRHLLPLGGRAGEGLKSRDHALYLLGESELILYQEALIGEATGAGARAGRDPALLRAALSRFQAVGQMRESRFAVLARARGADCLFLQGDAGFAAARAIYQDLLAHERTRPELDPASLRLRLADIAAAQGRDADARTELRRLYIDHPLHPLAETALGRLRTADEALRLEAAEHVARARTMVEGRRWGDALTELARVPAELSPALRDEVDYWVGTAHFKMRRGYDIAADKLLGVAPRLRGERQAEAMFHGARALSRADLDERAIAGYRAVVLSHPGSRYAAEASFLAGWLEYNRGRYAQALPALSETARRFPGKFGEEARWYAGFSRYLIGDDKGALADLQALGGRPGPHADKARYFSGRVQLRLGQKAEAAETFKKLVGGRPLSYYALLARVRLRELGQDAPPFDPAATAAGGLTLGPVEEALAGDERVARVDELLAAELPIEAGYELRRAEGALLTRYGAARALPLLFDRYGKAENFQRPHLLGEGYGSAALRTDPHGKAATASVRRFWEQVYPLAYRPLVEQYAKTGFNPPRYLYTIMQKESAYNPHDVSYADAIGLLQMIPPTSMRVAGQIGHPYTDDVLYDPEGNIQFGSWYIGRLLRKFKGQIALGAGSFNAGPKAMVRWIKQNGDRPLDEFIELCAYTQTREYMKKVLDIYAHYVYLWDKEQYLPQMKIDKDYLSGDGIDY